MGGKIKIIDNEAYHPEVPTTAEWFKYLGRHLFAANSKVL